MNIDDNTWCSERLRPRDTNDDDDDDDDDNDNDDGFRGPLIRPQPPLPPEEAKEPETKEEEEQKTGFLGITGNIIRNVTGFLSKSPVIASLINKLNNPQFP